MRSLTIIMIVVFFLLVLAGSAAAQGDLPPPFPQAFYGEVTIRSAPAPVGTVVKARGANVKLTSTNPITTTVAGAYGGPRLSEVKLGVQGWIEPRTPIYFYLNGERAEVSRDGVTWTDSIPFQSGIVSRVHLRRLWRVYYLPIWFVGEEVPEDE